MTNTNTTKANVITNKVAIEAAIKALNGEKVENTAAVIEKLNKLAESLNKKSGLSDKAKKAKSEKDEKIKAEILLALSDTAFRKATEVVHNSQELFAQGISSQKVTYLLKELAEEGKVIRQAGGKNGKGSFEYKLAI